MQNIPKDSSFENFIDTIIISIKKKFGNGYKLEPTTIRKNNSKELDGIIIRNGDKKVAPTIYLNDYYERYLYGYTLDEITHEIIHEYKEALLNISLSNEELNYDIDYLKDSIVYRVVNLKYNKILLDTMPHIPYLDLAITFHCLVHCNDSDIGTIRITYDLLKYFDVTLDELKKIACKNTIRLLPPKLQPMRQVISTLMTDTESNKVHNKEQIDNVDYLEKEDIVDKAMSTDELNGSMNSNIQWDCDMEIPYFRIDEKGLNKKDMFVLTNERGINGASCILYPSLIKKIATALDSDLYILPSSIHELIIVAKENGYDKEELEKMVAEINETEVPVEDILSNRVYVYSKERDGISF